MKIVDYRPKAIKAKGIKSKEYSHLLLLLYWPLYGLAFLTVERFLNLDYTAIHCALDDKIPFCEWFVIPYYLWFLFLGLIMIYSFFLDVPAFKKYMWFTIITYSITIAIYIIYPNKQSLRPDTFSRDNVLVDIVRMLYAFDTDTNVCPSLHVIGSLAVLFTAWNSKYLSGKLSRLLFTFFAVLISISTVFLKQHSIIDVLAGMLLSFIVYPFVFGKYSPLSKSSEDKAAAKPQKETATV